MNERIKELAEQAGFIDSRFSESGDNCELEIKKLIELTVRECIECTKEWRDAVRADSTRDYSRGYVHGCDDAIVEMKIRFGVEE